ncbi:MAG: class I SAM-dependent methyltransferase [Acidimicrobiales bacterium]
MTSVLEAYAGQSWQTRLHVWGRRRSCPFDAVADRVPPAGTVLDIGCGHGLWSLTLAAASPERTVLGVDIDADKLLIAAAAAARLGLHNVRFEHVETGWLPAGEWDAVVLVDVLYLLPADVALALLKAAASSVAPGGVVLVKEMDVRPRLKYEWNRFQELLATRVLRITEGEVRQFLAPDEMAAELEGGGLETEEVPLHRRSLHPHHLVIGRNPKSRQ